jgi:hypothetical protein
VVWCRNLRPLHAAVRYGSRVPADFINTNSFFILIKSPSSIPDLTTSLKAVDVSAREENQSLEFKSKRYHMAEPKLRRLVADYPPRRPGFEPGSGHVGFVVDKEAWDRFSPSTSVSPANLHSTNCSTITLICHLGLVQ